ncbi:hypothetical protein HYV64_02520 [Candidatus Shapirobacteria bacterium]|nr:hypothetical protein [Candidatus Shapirobacteria bacterium]
MITSSLISSVREFAKVDGPMETHQLIANEAGQKISQLLHADPNIVLLGTLLMDCVIGIAIQENRMAEHVSMCQHKAKELLDQDPDITPEEKNNVLACVLEHHGVPKFTTLESEIVCNSDCYRFASVKGFYYSLRYFRQMPDENFISLVKVKFNEKRNCVTLDIVKNELKYQFIAIENYLNLLK